MRSAVILTGALFITALLLPLSTYAGTSGTLRPIADGSEEGAKWENTTGVKCSATDCYTELNESSGSSCTSSDGDTSYIQNDVQGENQTFDIDLSGIINDVTITQIDVTVCYASGAKKEVTNNFQTRYCIDGSCSNSGSDITTGPNYTEKTQSFSGLSIAKTDGTDLEIGVSITGATKEAVRISQIFAVVTHTGNGDADAGSGSTGGGGHTPRSVTLSGMAYPGSSIEVFRKRIREERQSKLFTEPVEVGEDGSFSITHVGGARSDYFFALQAKDVDGRTTGLFSVIAPYHSKFFSVEDILMPPTMDIDKSIVLENGVLNVQGYATPHHTVELEVDGGVYTTIEVGTSGFWEFNLNATYLPYGEHRLRVRQVSNDEETMSTFSLMRIFKKTELSTPKADLNNDGVIDTLDWSIFLFRWTSDDESIRMQNDLTNDGRVDVFDFSVFLNSIKR